MINSKFPVLGVAILIMGGMSSAFKSFETPPFGPGSYMAKNGLNTAPDYYDTRYLTETKTGEDLPPYGFSIGQCAVNALNICAAKYDMDGSLIEAKQGVYIPSDDNITSYSSTFE